MGESKIEWTDKTWNPVTGCSKVSAGCKNCYAERLFPKVYPGRAFTDVQCYYNRLAHPLGWRKPCMVFVNSMSDLFHEAVPDEFIDRVFAVMALCPRHTFQILTKRPERMREYLSGDRATRYLVRKQMDRLGADEDAAWAVHYGLNWPLPNVWLGVSVEDQGTADGRIPDLLATPAAVRFISYEPALGAVKSKKNWMRDHYFDPVTATGHCMVCGGTESELQHDGLDWIICGGESGAKARPMHPDWARSVRDQCQEAGVAFFFKQGSKANWPDYKNFDSFPKDLQIREMPG